MSSDDVTSIPPIPEPIYGPLTKEEKTWAMLCHITSLLGWVAFGLAFLGPLVCWLMKKDTSRYVDMHGKESLNFQLNILIYTVAVVVLSIVTCGIGAVLAPVLLLWSVIGCIIAGIKANNGEVFRYPFVFRIIT